MNWKQRLEFLRASHLATLHPDLQLARKDLVCSQCGHYHGEIWHMSHKTILTFVDNAVVSNGGSQIKVVPVCNWCSRKNNQALPYEKSLAKISQLKEILRLKELKKYYPQGKLPREYAEKLAKLTRQRV